MVVTEHAAILGDRLGRLVSVPRRIDGRAVQDGPLRDTAADWKIKMESASPWRNQLQLTARSMDIFGTSIIGIGSRAL